ncbi:transposase [Candidatus Parcubacteria bacterium]|nr:transposase [Patescibacteria group bacterium]MCG2693027.1 transposase [Candidatus Parcubacteria bacterium]
MSKRSNLNEYPIHFVTTNVNNNIFLFNREQYCQIIVDNLKFYRNKYKFKLYAWVIIPWHIHLLLELLEGIKIQDVMRDFKKYSAVQIVQQLKKDERIDLLQKFSLQDGIPDYKSTLGVRYSSAVQGPQTLNAHGLRTVCGPKGRATARRKRTRKFQVFEEDYYDFNVYTEEKFFQKINYIEIKNPVKHRLVKTQKELENYKWSSYRSRCFGDNSVIKVDVPEM